MLLHMNTMTITGHATLCDWLATIQVIIKHIHQYTCSNMIYFMTKGLLQTLNDNLLKKKLHYCM